MSDATTTDTPVLTRGFSCLCCGSQDSTISLDLDFCDQFRCDSCNETFATDDLEAHLAAGQRLLRMAAAAKAAGLADLAKTAE